MPAAARIPNLPGRATVSGDGRADAHVAVDAAGELYIFSKTDGMLRVVVAALVAREIAERRPPEITLRVDGPRTGGLRPSRLQYR